MTEQQKTSVYKDLVIVVLVLVLIVVVWKQGKKEHAYQASEERQNRLYEQVAMLQLDSTVNNNLQDSLIRLTEKQQAVIDEQNKALSKLNKRYENSIIRIYGDTSNLDSKAREVLEWFWTNRFNKIVTQ